MKGEIMPIGVAISGANPLISLEKVASLGMSTCQMSVPPEKWWSKKRIELIRRIAEEKEIEITSLICGFKGESYRDISTIKRTVGLLNPATRGKRVLKVFSYSEFGLELRIKVIQAHIGFIPEDTSDPDYRGLVLASQKIADHCKDGKRPERKGELGKEYPLGEGDVDIEKFIDKLRKIGYAGHLTIEREISGEKQIRDILKAKELLQKLINKE
ncbi:MAG TPA: hypothetical protein ENH69_01025 [Candidatus Aerophobetes bacterium]|uniref:Uncharacterized protein n=1 Tax=Aerophobetes bacterium TaxID=2030807 RepID=A0A7C1RDS0_UNCAE|nr:hypothetical protein [Candidatus Aerophobetes bacterium]